jgi:hypothetical protein
LLLFLPQLKFLLSQAVVVAVEEQVVILVVEAALEVSFIILPYP